MDFLYPVFTWTLKRLCAHKNVLERM